MRQIDATTAMCRESEVIYRGELYEIVAIVSRPDFRYEPVKPMVGAVLSRVSGGERFIIEESGPDIGYPVIVPLKEIEITGGKENGKRNSQAH